MRGRLAEATD